MNVCCYTQIAVSLGKFSMLVDDTTKQHIPRNIGIIVLKQVPFVLYIHHQKLGERSAENLIKIHQSYIDNLVEKGCSYDLVNS